VWSFIQVIVGLRKILRKTASQVVQREQRASYICLVAIIESSLILGSVLGMRQSCPAA
jgi:hypothetical protein